jgi:hypothetical protein
MKILLGRFVQSTVQIGRHQGGGTFRTVGKLPLPSVPLIIEPGGETSRQTRVAIAFRRTIGAAKDTFEQGVNGAAAHLLIYSLMNVTPAKPRAAG